jgi:hypothetical protein
LRAALPPMRVLNDEVQAQEWLAELVAARSL